MTEVREQMTDDRGQSDRGQRTVDRKQRLDDRNWNSEVGRRNAE